MLLQFWHPMKVQCPLSEENLKLQCVCNISRLCHPILNVPVGKAHAQVSRLILYLCIISHWRHCMPLLNTDADVFNIHPKPHSKTHCGVKVRLRPVNHGGANFRIGQPKNTLGAVLWLRAPSASPKEWTCCCHSCLSRIALHVCGIYGVARSPSLHTIFKFTVFSHFSDVGIGIVLYPLGDITFLLSLSSPVSTWPFINCSLSTFELISSYML